MRDGTLLGALLALITTIPFAWKWCLGLRRTLPIVAALAVMFSFIVVSLGNLIPNSVTLRVGLVWLLSMMAAAGILAYRFYRDPERKAPEGDGVIVSPADGEVIYIRHAQKGMLPVSTKRGRQYTLWELIKTPIQSEDAVVIGIAMSFLDVHVNRAPITGRVTRQHHYPGRFGSLRLPEMVFENERVTTIIEAPGLQVTVVQIASRLVRQIVSFVRETQEVTLGQRIGVIRLGSQVDLVLPAREDLQVLVKPGQRVWAGQSVVAQLRYAAVSSVNPTPLPELQVVQSAGSRIIDIDPLTDPRWQDFVTTHSDALIYHHPRWLEVIAKAYGHKPVCFACEAADGQLRGILPLFHTRGLFTGSRLSSLPHTPVAGPLAYDDQSTAALIRAAIGWVQQNPGTRLQLKLPWGGLDELVKDMVGLRWEETYVLELPEGSEELRFGNPRNQRRIKWAINKAAKEGVQVRCAESEHDLKDWYAIYLGTMRRHAVPPRPYRFFKLAWELLRPDGLMRLLLAEQHQGGQRRLLAGSLFLMFGQTVSYAFNGRQQQVLSLRPNDVIQWQAIQDAHRNGFRHYDFGEVAEGNEGLAEFKTKWGAEPKSLYRCYYPAAHELETSVLKSGGTIRQLASSAWRRLPLRLTAVLGDHVYRHL